MTITRSRWLTKKAARSSVMLGSWAARSIVQRVSPSAGPRVRVLTYHSFGGATRDPWCVSPDVFEAQVRWLAERNLAVSLDEVLQFVRGERTLPDGAALITTDDGYSSVATIAAPILKRYAVPSVAYITTAVVNTQSVDPRDPYMTWDQVAALPDSGVTLGSHAHRHRSLGKMSLSEAQDEGARSRELLQTHTGRSIDSFAYPYGMRHDETEGTRRVLGELGYRSVFIAQHGTIQQGSDVLRLPRIKVEGGEPAWMFRYLCQGGMDVWRLVDDTMWVLQRPER